MDVVSVAREFAIRPLTPPVGHIGATQSPTNLEQLHAHFLAPDRFEQQCIESNTVPFPADLQRATEQAVLTAQTRHRRPQAAFLARYDATNASIFERRAALTSFLQKVASRTANIERGSEARICEIISGELRSLDVLPVPERLLWAHVATHLIDHSSAVRAAPYFSQLTGQIRAALRLKPAEPHTQLVLAGAALPTLIRHGSPTAAATLFARCLELALAAPPQTANDKLIFHLLDIGTSSPELRPLLSSHHAMLMSRIEQRFFMLDQSERTKSMLTLAVMQAVANAGHGEFLVPPRLMSELIGQLMRTLSVAPTHENSLLTTNEQSLFTLAALSGVTSNKFPFAGEEITVVCRHALAVTAARLKRLDERRDHVLAQRLITAMGWIGSRSVVAANTDLHQNWFTLVAENIHRLEFPGASALPVMEYAYRFRRNDFPAISAVALAIRKAASTGSIAMPQVVRSTLTSLAALTGGNPLGAAHNPATTALSLMQDPYFTPVYGRDELALALLRYATTAGDGHSGADLPEIAQVVARTLTMPYVDGQARLALLHASQHLAVPETLNTACTKANLRLLQERRVSSSDQIAVIGALIRLTGANADRPLDHAQRDIILAAQWRLQNMPLPPRARAALSLLLAGSYTAAERNWFIDEVLA